MSVKPPKTLEMIISNYVRNNYENKYNKHNLPMALKYLILKFSNKIIGSNLLSLKEDLDCFKLLQSKISNIKQFNLLFTASEHDYCSKQFHSFCDDNGSTLTIIKSNHGNLFGGYTSKSWTSNGSGRYIKDENAFLFLLKSNKEKLEKQCPFSFNVKSGYSNHAIYCDTKYGPTFGFGKDIYIGSYKYAYTQKRSYNYAKFDGNISGNNNANDVRFEIVEYQIFQLE